VPAPSLSKSERAPSTSVGSGAQPRAWLWLVPLLAVIALIYAFASAAGNFRHWPVYSTFFDLLAEGFRRGQLSLAYDPPPELLALPNPYDRANGHYWLVDATLHDGKYYLYWGPLPALLQALAKSVARINHLVGDQYLLVFFSSLSALFGALLIEGMRRRMFSNVPRWLSGFCILALAFANPVVYLVTSPAQYQVAIGGGQTFMVGGMWCACQAVWEQTSDSRRGRWLILAGTSFALALACRISLAAAAGLVAALTVIASSWPRARRLGSMLTHAICIGVAPVIVVGLLLLYNKLRFDSWLDFGMKEQLSYFDFRVSPRYFLTNLYAYALTPFEWSCQFPYALQSWAHGPKGVAAWVPLPDDYLVLEPISGFLSASPISWLFPVPLFVAARHLRDVKLPAYRAYVFCASGFGALGSISGILVLFVYSATMRYLGDFIYGVVLLGVLGGFTWVGAQRRSSLGHLAACTAVATLCLATVVLGLLLAYQGYNQHFASFNPELNRTLIKRLSVCELFVEP
jgi:hypothetical protein